MRQRSARGLIVCGMSAALVCAAPSWSATSSMPHLGPIPLRVRGARTRIPTGLAAAIRARLGAEPVPESGTILAIGTFLASSVALSADGTTALVGAPGVAGGKGAAYIFHASGAGSWSSSRSPVATLTNRHGAARGQFGTAVTLSADGTTAFVGAPFASGGSPRPGPLRIGSLGTGAIYEFHVSAEDAWRSSSKPTATLTASDGVLLGSALALSSDGTTLVAGAPFYKSAPPYRKGGGYVFHASSEGAWASSSKPTATLSDASPPYEDALAGTAVAISGDGTTALLGDSQNMIGGGAYLYHVSAEDSWTSSSEPTATLTDTNVAPNNDALGDAVALSADGTVALLGDPYGNSGKGKVDVFHASGQAAWTSTSTPTGTLTNGSTVGQFARNLALSSDGTTALVSDTAEDASRGAADLFHVSAEGAWASRAAPTAMLTNSAGQPNDSLGEPGVLSSDGETALVGALGVRKWTGAADIFHVTNESSWTSSSDPNATLTDNALAACVVPKIKGLKLTAAKAALGVGRCRLGKVTRLTSTKKGRVLSQSRKPGTRLAIGAKVAVKVGK